MAKEMGLDRAPVEFQTFYFSHVLVVPPNPIVLILPWSWVGGNTHGLRGYPEAEEALQQKNCHWRT